MGSKFEELKTIVESLYEWAVKHGEQSYLAIFIMDDHIKVFNDLELPAEKQFGIDRWDGQWRNGKSPAAESAGESKN